MNDKLRNVLNYKYKAEIEDAKYKIKCYSDQELIIPEHPDITGEVDGTPYLTQWRWRCTFRDAYYVCLVIWPFAHTKLPKVQQVIEHYATEKLNGKKANLIDFEEAKKQRAEYV